MVEFSVLILFALIALAAALSLADSAIRARHLRASLEREWALFEKGFVPAPGRASRPALQRLRPTGRVAKPGVVSRHATGGPAIIRRELAPRRALGAA